MSRARFLDGVSHAGLIDPAQWKCELGTGGLRLGLGLFLGGGAGGGGGPTPPVSGALRGGVNLVLKETNSTHFGPQRNYANLAKSARWTNASGNPIYEPHLIDGELVSLPSGVAPRKALAAFPRIDGGGVVRVRAEWTGATTGTFSGGATSNQTNGGSGSSDRWAECDVTVPADRAMTATSFVLAFSSTTIPPQNLWISETSLIATKPIFDPQYVADFAGSGKRILRWMDWGRTNGQWYGDDYSDTMESEWGNRPHNPWSAQPLGTTNQASILLGSGDGMIAFEQYWYVGSTGQAAKLANYLPEHAFGRSVNEWSISVVAPSGAGSVVRDGTNKHFIVTPPASGVGNDIITLFMNSVAAGMFRCRTATASETGGSGSGTSGASTGTGLPGTMAQTTFSGGQQLGGGGPPLEDIVALSNATGIAPWVCLPARCSIEFAVEAVKYLNANLSSACKPFYIELANEWWNFAAGFVTFYINIAWGIKNGLTTEAEGNPAPWHAKRQVDLFTAIGAEVPRGASTWKSVCNIAAANQAWMDQMEAWPGLSPLIDAYATAPYFSGGGGATIAECYDNAIDDIEDVAIVRAQQAHDKAAGYGKQHLMYEGGQHDTFVGKTLYDAWQRSDEMGEAIHYYLSEMQYAVPNDTFVFFNENYPVSGTDAVGGNSNAWGLIEYVGQPLADAPKAQAYDDAINAHWKPYIRRGHEPVTTGSRLVGQPLTADWSDIRRATSGSYQWFNESGDISGATAATYVQQASDAGKHVECRLTGITDYGSVIYETTGAGVTNSGYEAEATALFARMSVQPNDARKGAINNVFLALKNGALSGTNLLTKMRTLHVFAAHDAQAASLDWLSSDTITLLASPTFTADSGYTGTNQAAGDIRLAKTPAQYGAEASPKFTRDDAHVMAWVTTRVGASDAAIGRNTGSSGNLYITSQAAAGNATLRINQSSGVANATGGSADGMWLANRSGASAAQFYKNATSIGGGAAGTTEASTALQTDQLVIGRNSTQTHRFVGIGLSLTANQVADLYNALRAYATAVGLP